MGKCNGYILILVLLYRVITSANNFAQISLLRVFLLSFDSYFLISFVSTGVVELNNQMEWIRHMNWTCVIPNLNYAQHRNIQFNRQALSILCKCCTFSLPWEQKIKRQRKAACQEKCVGHGKWRKMTMPSKKKQPKQIGWNSRLHTFRHRFAVKMVQSSEIQRNIKILFRPFIRVATGSFVQRKSVFPAVQSMAFLRFWKKSIDRTSRKKCSYMNNLWIHNLNTRQKENSKGWNHYGKI